MQEHNNSLPETEKPIAHYTLWFVAILPPPEIAGRIRTIQQEIADRFGPRRALRLPPHITVEPPFRLGDERANDLVNHLARFGTAHNQFHLELHNFGSFRHDVIFIEVAPNLTLLEMQGELSRSLRGDGDFIREAPYHPGYTPHLTVANRDVTPRAHHAIWAEFNTRKFYAEFAVRELCLLRHDGSAWHIHAQFPLRSATDEDISQRSLGQNLS